MGWCCWSPYVTFSVGIFKKRITCTLSAMLGGFWDMCRDIEKEIYSSFIAAKHSKRRINAYAQKLLFSNKGAGIMFRYGDAIFPYWRYDCHKIILSPLRESVCWWPWDGVFVSKYHPVACILFTAIETEECSSQLPHTHTSHIHTLHTRINGVICFQTEILWVMQLKNIFP